MKFSNEKPPIFDRLQNKFDVEWGKSLVVAYNDTIYHTEPLHPSVLVHEAVHLERQKGNADEWFSKYIDNEEFRFKEELLAYKAQYKYLEQTIKDRNELARLLFRLASDLSGSMYGNVISINEAIKLLKLK